MVMWARQRLQVYLGLVDNMSVAAARARVASNARELEDEHRLEQLVSAVAKLADMRRAVAQLLPGEVPGWKGVVDMDKCVATSQWAATWPR
ncbi:hypothetical protein F5X68DRAFT_214487 [Plectosphaerella plurivora]|uniref:Uncharacterized protein n=1 Tax=Plectosphaerella plurivora TaxID=936078 RepID=A0A9P8V4B1_9PEZI|nr:hypothetical protein F5X68DRAFT_214487 [Plectosphaerella plurivora]